MSQCRFTTLLLLSFLSFAAESRQVFKDTLRFASLGFPNGNVTSEGTDWAVLVAGSYGYWNYRHQADVCHAYQVLKKGGLEDDNIVVFMYDDIAFNKENPTPGVIINRPKGENVYEGVPKDYTGEHVTTNNLFGVLLGNTSALTGGSGKVVKSGPHDHIFIYYSDHGTPGVLEMPNDHVTADEFIRVLKQRHASISYKSMVIYVEACEAGSLFEGILPNNMSIYALTASNATEESYAAYCEDNNNVCLGDIFSVAWMEDSDTHDRQKETLRQQYEVVQNQTANIHNDSYSSHTMQYGDLRIQEDLLSTYQGVNHDHILLVSEFVPSNPKPMVMNQYDADLYHFIHKVNNATPGSQQLEARRQLQAEISCGNYVDQSIDHIAQLLFGNKHVTKILKAPRPPGKPIVDDWDCFKKLINVYNKHCGYPSGYAMKHVRVIANMCNFGIGVDQLAHASIEACQPRPRPPCKTLF